MTARALLRLSPAPRGGSSFSPGRVLGAVVMVIWAWAAAVCGQNVTSATLVNVTTNVTIVNVTTTAMILPRNRTVRVNVTLGGFGTNRTLRVPPRWGAALAWEATDPSTGECPRGRYCPGGVGSPKVCKAGTYSPYAGRQSPCPESEACHANSYCPDPGVMVSCPKNTWSGYRSTSRLDCRCQPGFECVYKKQVNLNMVLHVPLGVWMSESGKFLREKLVQAVAESAGVSSSNVRIDQVLPYQGVGGGGSRRLLDSSKDALLVRLTLQGAEAVGEDALQARLAQMIPLSARIRHLHFHDVSRRIASVHWARADRVHVKPSKPWTATNHHRTVRTPK